MFRVEVGIACTLKHNLIVGVRAFHCNPYDGYTLADQLEQATIQLQDSAAQPATAFVNLCYRAVDVHNQGEPIALRGKSKRISAQERRQLRRRQAIEPIIDHLKADHRLDRCPLKGEIGDRQDAVRCAASYNIKWLLRMIVRRGMSFLRSAFLWRQ